MGTIGALCALNVWRSWTSSVFETTLIVILLGVTLMTMN